MTLTMSRNRGRFLRLTRSAHVPRKRRLCRLQVRRHVTSPVECSVRQLDRRTSQEFANTEVFLTDELDADDIAFLIEINHCEAVFSAERLGPSYLRSAKSHICRCRFRIDFTTGVRVVRLTKAAAAFWAFMSGLALFRRRIHERMTRELLALASLGK